MQPFYLQIRSHLIILIGLLGIVSADWDDCFLVCHPKAREYLNQLQAQISMNFGPLAEFEPGNISLVLQNYEYSPSLERSLVGSFVKDNRFIYIFQCCHLYCNCGDDVDVRIFSLQKLPFLPLDNASSQPVSLSIVTEGTDTLIIATIISDPFSLSVYKLRYEQINGDSGTYAPELLTTHEMENQIILSLVQDNELNNDGPQNVIWALGRGGTIRRVTLNKGGIKEIKNYDCNITESITAYGEGYFGTKKGKIFQFDTTSEKFVFDSKPCDSEIRHIQKDLATGVDGTFIRHFTDGTWKAYQVPGRNTYKYGYLAFNHLGFSVALIDTAWGSRRFIYQNDSTSISSVTPDSLEQNINAQMATYSGELDYTITIKTSDPEGNHTVPLIIQKNNNGATIIPIPLMPMRFYDFDGVVRLKKNEHTFIFNTDFFTYKAEAERCYENPFAPDLFSWEDEPYSDSVAWSPRDTICIIFGMDTLGIWCYGISEISSQSYFPFPERMLYVKGKTHMYTIKRPAGRVDNLEIRTIQGRLISSINCSKKSLITLPKNLAEGILVFSFISGDKNIKSLIINNCY